MEINGLDKFNGTLNRCINNFDSESKKALVRVGNKLLGKVKLRTPVDTGQLRNSWRIKQDSNSVTVFNNSAYSGFVEYGHRTRGGNSMVEGRYMLTKSVEEIKEDLEDEFEIMIENLWK